MPPIEEKKRRQLKKSEKVLIIVFLCAASVLLLYLFMRSQMDISREMKQQREEREQAEAGNGSGSDENENEPRILIPLNVFQDTDNVRRYGYDVLYAYKDIKIMLGEIRSNKGHPETDIEIINDSDKSVDISLAYSIYDGCEMEPDFSCTVPARSTSKQMITCKDERLKDVNIGSMRFSFKVESKDDEIYDISRPITIVLTNGRYDSWSPPDSAVLLLDDESISLWNGGLNYKYDSSMGYARIRYYLRNKTNTDFKIMSVNEKLYDKDGKEIDPEKYTVFFAFNTAGRSLSENHIRILLNDDYSKAAELGKLEFVLKLWPRSYNSKIDPELAVETAGTDDDEQELEYTVTIDLEQLY